MPEISGNAKLIRDKRITGDVVNTVIPVYSDTVDEFVLTEAADISGVGAYTRVTRTAGEALGGHRVVRQYLDGAVYYASNTSDSHKHAVLGITVGAVESGNTATVQTYGELLEPSWTWTPGLPIFLTTNGQLSQTAPSSGFVLIIGTAQTATQVFINIKQPIVKG